MNKNRLSNEAWLIINYLGGIDVIKHRIMQRFFQDIPKDLENVRDILIECVNNLMEKTENYENWEVIYERLCRMKELNPYQTEIYAKLHFSNLVYNSGVEDYLIEMMYDSKYYAKKRMIIKTSYLTPQKKNFENWKVSHIDNWKVSHVANWITRLGKK